MVKNTLVYHSMNNNTGNPLTAVLIVSLNGSSQLCLVFIKISCLYDVNDDVKKAEGSVPNCTASYWSVLFT